MAMPIVLPVQPVMTNSVKFADRKHRRRQPLPRTCALHGVGCLLSDFSAGSAVCYGLRTPTMTALHDTVCRAGACIIPSGLSGARQCASANRYLSAALDPGEWSVLFAGSGRRRPLRRAAATASSAVQWLSGRPVPEQATARRAAPRKEISNRDLRRAAGAQEEGEEETSGETCAGAGLGAAVQPRLQHSDRPGGGASQGAAAAESRRWQPRR